MSFAGHIYDMIRRDRENRELRQRLRGRIAERSGKIIGKYPHNPNNISSEKIDQIRNDLKIKSARDEYQMQKSLILCLGLGLFVLIVCILFFIH